MYALDDTIAAVASPPGGAARGVVRLTGPNLIGVLESCFRPDPPLDLGSVTVPTTVSGMVELPSVRSSLPCALYLWPGRRSYTGQPAAEIHTIGSPPLLDAVVRAACIGGARQAEPGEFTLRAFLAGRIDLTQAEAVLGVIDATGPQEFDAALKQLAGGLAGPLQRLRHDLVELLAHLEAGFDFADEDLAFITAEELLCQLTAAAEIVSQLVMKLTHRSESAVRVRVVLGGRPNAGKSSLFNALTGNSGAIVSDQPGTTRDYLTADLDLDGVRCQLIDTAGISKGLGAGGLETQRCQTAGIDLELQGKGAAGVQAAAEAKSHEQLRTAEIQLYCVDSGTPEVAPEAEQGKRLIIVRTKCDWIDLAERRVGSRLEVSAVTSAGIPRLREVIRAAVLEAAGPQTEIVVGTAIRCGESLRLAAFALERARAAVQTILGEELIAAEVRAALTEIGKVAGAVYTEDVLDSIFSRFCIGK